MTPEEMADQIIAEMEGEWHMVFMGESSKSPTGRQPGVTETEREHWRRLIAAAIRAGEEGE